MTYTFEQARQHLPQIVCDIADVIGFAATEQLIKAIGGTTFAFGQGIRETARLRILFTAIGQPKTYKLLSVFGGSEEYIPRCDKAFRRLRNARFKADYVRLRQEGMSGTLAMTQLCPQYGIADRTGWEIIRDMADPVTRQQDLF